MIEKSLEYRNHEIILQQDHDLTFTIDIRADDFEGEWIGAYSQCRDSNEAWRLAKAFIDGIYFDKESDYDSTGTN